MTNEGPVSSSLSVPLPRTNRRVLSLEHITEGSQHAAYSDRIEAELDIYVVRERYATPHIQR